jgi:methylase of polypeptide subunit release factors
MMNAADGLIRHALSRRDEINDHRRRITVVEFCAGSGFIALPLSFLFPDVTFVIIDLKVLTMRPCGETWL